MTEPLTVITWLWKPLYEPRHVYAVQTMLAAHLHCPYRFVCVTDQPETLGGQVDVVPLWDMPPTAVKRGLPNCYRRLWVFSDEAKAVLGAHLVSIDLDVVIRGDITSLFDSAGDFTILQGSACPYNGSLWYLKTGTRTKAWVDFHPVTSPKIIAQQRRTNGQHYIGSDQAWLSYKLPGEQVWTTADGIYQYVATCLGKKGSARLAVPDNCRIMFFAGGVKPWQERFRIQHPPLYEAYKVYSEGSSK